MPQTQIPRSTDRPDVTTWHAIHSSTVSLTLAATVRPLATRIDECLNIIRITECKSHI